MSASINPISGAAFSSLIFEIENNVSALFGPSPLDYTPTAPEQEMALGRLSSALAFLRDRVVPRVFNSLNTSQITIIRRSESAVAGDPLGKVRSETADTVYAVISGPTSESLERGLLDVSDYEVLIPAYTLGAPLTEEDAIKIDDVNYDIVGIQGHPKVPSPVAWRYWCKRVA